MFAILEQATERLWKTWEEHTTRWWDTTLRSPTTLKGLGGSLNAMCSVKEHWDRSLEQTWAHWRLPSAGDLERLYQRIGELEHQLADVSERLEEQAEARAAVGAAEADRA